MTRIGYKCSHFAHRLIRNIIFIYPVITSIVLWRFKKNDGRLNLLFFSDTFFPLRHNFIWQCIFFFYTKPDTYWLNDFLAGLLTSTVKKKKSLWRFLNTFSFTSISGLYVDFIMVLSYRGSIKNFILVDIIIIIIIYYALLWKVILGFEFKQCEKNCKFYLLFKLGSCHWVQSFLLS